VSAVDSLADKLRAKSAQLAGQGGVKDKLATELATDADFVRKLKPELIKKRVKGEAPTDAEPTDVQSAPSGPQLGARPKAKRPSGPGNGPNPFVVIGVALVLGVALAKWLDWRGHAHPRW
jgi:hypothetical protein